MKAVSKKRAAYLRQITPDRNAWRDEIPQRCMNCRSTINLQIHEIERKSKAKNRWGHRCNYLLLCTSIGDYQGCHDGPFATASHAEQLAVKFAEDNHHYNLERWRQIGGRPDSYVTEDDVFYWVWIHRNVRF